MKKTKDSLIVIKRLALRMFGNYADKYTLSFDKLRHSVLKSGMDMIFRTYLSLLFFISLVAFVLSFAGVCALYVFGIVPVFYVLVAPIVLMILAFAAVYFYPFFIISSRRRSIETNLPFAVNHMAAIASSGVPPFMMFKLLSGFGDYGEVSRESGKIIRNMEVFGQDITTSLREVAERTPSKTYRDLLEGILAIIETGGNLQSYLMQQSDNALFEYRLKREKYMEILSTYADFYTAVLIAAPMFLVAILAIMNMIGGELFGMQIDEAMNIGIFVLMPIVNTGFIIFVHMTQPEI